MNTFQLAQVLTKDPFTKGSFSGVYACDELTSIEINEYPKSFVVNTDPMELPGTHWIALWYSPPGTHWTLFDCRQLVLFVQCIIATVFSCFRETEYNSVHVINYTILRG